MSETKKATDIVIEGEEKSSRAQKALYGFKIAEEDETN